MISVWFDYKLLLKNNLKMFKKANQFLKLADLFGHKVSLNFGSFLNKHEKGKPIYKTSFGGAISLFIYLIFGYFVYFFF